MNFARGLLNDPWILFLDEPTLGLDVAAARAVRELVRAWKAAVPGRTVLLTTHYMAEADELCERIAIVDHGRILAIGSPDELKRRVQRESIFRARARPPRRRRGGARPAPRASSRRRRRPTTAARRTARRVDLNLVLERGRGAGRRGRRARAAWARTSWPCASPSRRSRTCSWSSSVGGSTTTGRADGSPPDDDRATPPRTADRPSTKPASPPRRVRLTMSVYEYRARDRAGGRRGLDAPPGRS